MTKKQLSYSELCNHHEGEYNELDLAQYPNVIKALEQKQDMLKNIFEKDKRFTTVLEKVEQLAEDIVNLKKRLDPPVYLSVSKDKRTEVSNIIAKTNWTEKTGKKNISVYVGQTKDFKLGAKDPMAKKIAYLKMKDKLSKMPLPE